MRVGVLGPLSVDGAVDELSPRDRTVLSALAVLPGRHVSVDSLADALWGEAAPASANKVVQGCVSRLRRTLGAETIETSTHGYRLTMSADDIDHARFVRYVTEARELSTRGQFDRASSRLDEALALWRGEPLRDLAEWEPARADTARLIELHAEAAELRVDSLIQAGRHDEVLADARALVDHEPTREQRWAMLARAQYLAGQQGRALDTLQRARRVLLESLGIEPGADLRHLELLILQQDPELDVSEIASYVDNRCPYPGLAHFDIDDADDFFGRERELASALLRLRRDGVVLVVGPSGSGKSSLARAGIAATLRLDGLTVIVARPGLPADWRAATDAPAGSLLVVDQVEEIFALDEADRLLMADRMVRHRARGPIVATLRADRLNELATIPNLADLFGRSLHLLGPMTETELREAITGPALRAGLLLEPGLTDLLVQELAGEPGALPLLSHALQATWSRRDGRTLTVDGYRETGGVQQAINTSAESVFDGLDRAEQRVLRTLALRLVTPGIEGEPTRRRVGWDTIAPDALRRTLVERLVRARLLTSQDDTVMLAHEAVVRAWPRLRSWLEEDAESHRVLGHLATQTQTWLAMGRPDAELYRGGRLGDAEEWRDREQPDLTDQENEFLDASVALADAERAAIAERLDIQTRSNRKLRSLLIVATIAFLGAAAAGAVALAQSHRADRHAQAADAARVGALALSASDVDQALLLAVQAVRIGESEATRSSLLTVLGRVPALIGSAVLNGPAVAVDHSPDGRYVATGGPFDGLGLFDATSLERLGERDQPVASVSFSPDGELLAAGTNRYSTSVSGSVDFGPALVVYRSDTMDAHAVQPMLPGEGVEVPDLEFSGDGRVLVALARGPSSPPTLFVWNVETMGPPALEVPIGGEAFRLAVSPDGATAFVGVADAGMVTTRAVSLVDGRELGRLDLGGDGIAISPDGSVLALTDGDGTAGFSVALFDARTFDEKARLGPGTPVASMAFTAGGRRLVVADRTSTATVWDTETTEVIDELSTPSSSIWALDVSADGDRLVTTGPDRRLHLWDLDGRERTIRREWLALRSTAEAVVPHPNGRYVASAALTSLEIIDLDHRGGAPAPQVFVTGGLRILAWHPTEPTLAVGTDSGVIQVRDAATNSVVSEHRVGTDAITALEVATDENEIAFGTATGLIGTVDLDGNTSSTVDVGIDGEIVGIELIEARRVAVAVSSTRTVTLVDLADPAEPNRIELDFTPVRSAISPDGNRLVVVGAGGETGLLDVAQGMWIHEPLAVHDNVAFSASMSSDGNTFVTGGVDGRMVIWDGIDGSVSAVVELSEAPDIVVPIISADDSAIVVGSTEGAVYRWAIDTESLIDQACSVARRDLTPSEWSDALGDSEPGPTCF